MTMQSSTADPTRKLPVKRIALIALGALAAVALAAMLWRGVEANREASAALLELESLALAPIYIDAAARQNLETSGLSDAQIADLDMRYRADHEAGDGGMAAELMTRPASQALAAYVAGSQNRIIFIMVMDARGLDVAASRPTTDYYQGDEDKWRETFKKGPGAVHWGGLERDGPTGRLQNVVSRTLVDMKTGQAVGAIAIGFDSEMLKR